MSSLRLCGELRLVRQTAKVIFLEILAGITLLVLILLAGLAIRLASGPVELSMFEDDIERTLVRARDGRATTVDKVTLEWLRSEGRAIVVASDIVFFDTAGGIAAQAERAEILVNASALFLGRLEPIGLVLSSGHIDVQRTAEGWRFAGDPLGAIGEDMPEGEDIPPTDMLEQMNSAFADILELFRREASQSRLQTLRLEGFDVILLDEAGAEQIRLTGAGGEVLRDASGLTARLSGASEGVDKAPGLFSVSVTAPADYSRLDAAFEFNDWSVESLLAIGAGDNMSADTVPLDFKASFSVDAVSGLETISFESVLGAGTFRWQGQDIAVTSGAFTGSYKLETDKLNLVFTDGDIGSFAGGLSVEIDEVLHPDEAAYRPFRIESSRLDLDLRPIFSEVWPIRRLRSNGTFSISEKRMDVSSLTLKTADANLRATGSVHMLENVQSGELPVAARVTTEMSGALSIAELLRFWPTRQAPGARGYVMRNVLDGTIREAAAIITIDRDSNAEGYLSDDAIDATFSATGVSVKPLPDIPPVIGTNLTGKVTGNALRIDFNEGRFALWKVTNGFVHYPQLSPPGADMMVGISGTGPARSLARIVSDSRLQLEARSGFNPDNVSGEADMSFTLTRPALPDTPASSYRYQGDGTILDGGLANAFAGLDLIDSDARIELDEKAIRIFGFGEVAAAPLQYDWRYAFNSGGAPANLTASSVLTPTTLNEIGIVGRAYLSGEVPLQVSAELNGSQPKTIDVSFDLTSARLDVAEIGWIKAAGSPAGATVQVNEDAGVSRVVVALEADDAALEGVFSLEPDGRLIEAELDRAFLKGRVELRGSARRAENNGLVFDIRGPFLDLSRMVANVSQFGSGTPAAARVGDVALTAEIETLRLRDGFDMLRAKMDLTSNSEGLQTVEAAGVTESSAPLTAAFDASGLGDPAFRVTSGDASFLASVFLGTDALEDGELEMSGTFARGDLPTQVRLQIKDGRLKDAPVLTQLLSLASIRGLSDTLSGDGVLFSEIDIPLTIAGSRYGIVGAKASGPALGLTANGWVDSETGGLDVDGVLVPSFGVNSALGGIPIIGDMFVSRDGEGVLSLRYGVEGTLERAQVSVNPLSAITPGILRRIFEDPTDVDILDEPEDETDVNEDE